MNEKTDPEEGEKSHAEKTEVTGPPVEKRDMGKIIITILISSAIVIAFIGCIILISIQEEDGASNNDMEPPVVAFISPTGTLVFAPGDNISITIVTGEDEEAVPSVYGKITNGEYKVDLIDFTLNYTHDNEWSTQIKLPSDSPDGDWYIYIQAWDKNGNMGWIELPIQIHG